MPAVAPAMWLGMLAAAGAQIPGLPVEVVNLPASLCLGYIATVATWCARPEWASWMSASGRPGWLRPMRHGGGLAGASPLGPCSGAPSARGGRRRAALPALALAALAGLIAVSGGPAAPRRDRPRACGSPSSTSGRGTRFCSSPPGRRRSSSTGGRRGPASRNSSAQPGSRGWRLSSPPTTSPTTSGGSRSCWAGCRSGRSYTPGPAASLLAQARAAGVGLRRVAAGSRAALRASAPGCDLAAIALLMGGARCETPMHWLLSPSLTGAGSRCCSRPTPRPSRRRSTRGRSMSSRSPITAARTRASESCWLGPDHAWP